MIWFHICQICHNRIVFFSIIDKYYYVCLNIYLPYSMINIYIYIYVCVLIFIVMFKISIMANFPIMKSDLLASTIRRWTFAARYVTVDLGGSANSLRTWQVEGRWRVRSCWLFLTSALCTHAHMYLCTYITNMICIYIYIYVCLCIYRYYINIYIYI